MSNILSQAKLFLEACDTGKGWDGCEAYCHPGATLIWNDTVSLQQLGWA